MVEKYKSSSLMQELAEKRAANIKTEAKFKVSSATLNELEVGESYLIKYEDCHNPDDLDKTMFYYRTICSRYSKDGKSFGVVRHDTGFEVGRIA